MKSMITMATAAALGSVWIAAATAAQTYPERPIRFIIPFAPGGTSDIVGRLLAIKVGQDLGQTVVIDNRGGAGGTVGAGLAAKAPPDGHTIILGHISLAINQTLYPNLPYDAERDLLPVSRVGDTPNVVVVSALPVKTMKELLALAKKQPGKLDYGSGGFGSAGHLPVALLEEAAGVKFNHIPYKGGGPSVIATITGEVQFAVPALPTAAPHVKQGRLRVLAVTGAERSPAMPEAPTVAEAGVPGYEFSIWYGVFVPAGTPKDIIARLRRVLVQTLQTSEIQKLLSQQGIDVLTSTPEELGAVLRTDIVKWHRIMKAAGIKPE